VEEERGQGGGANAPLSTNCGSVEGEEATRRGEGTGKVVVRRTATVEMGATGGWG
jgi:hypothetical protein